MARSPSPARRGAPPLAAIVLLALAGCATTPDLPPICDPPSATRRPGAFVWRDLVTPAPARARAFYGAVLGWTFRPFGDAGYVVVRHDGRDVGGLIDAREVDPDATTAYWISTVSVPDVDDAAARVERAGGRVLRDPRPAAARGRMAVVADPHGGVVSLARSSSGDPPARDAPVHGWLWQELATPEPDRATAFYEAALGYELERVDADGYRVLRRGGERCAGVVESPFEEPTALWIPYVRVADAGAAAARVREAGGAVLLAPDPARRGGSVALVADPDGAILAIQTWPLEGDDS